MLTGSSTLTVRHLCVEIALKPLLAEYHVHYYVAFHNFESSYRLR